MKNWAGFIRREWPLHFIWAFMTIAYSAIGLFRHWHFQSCSFDSGVFDQAIWNCSQFRKPGCTLNHHSILLSDHFSPVIYLLAPLYWLVPRIEVLIIAQAVLLMLPIFPIFLFGVKRIGRLPSYFFAMAYSVFWGIQYAAAWDFHEICFSACLAAFAIYWIDEKRWKLFFPAVLLLMFSKEDMCLLGAFFGFYLMALGNWKKGIALAILGFAQLWLEIRLLIPALSDPGQGYSYWEYGQLGTGPLSALETCLFHPWKVVHVLFSNIQKIRLTGYLFAFFLFFPFFSPIFLLTVPLLASRLLSEKINFWGLENHYSAVLGVVMVFASVDGVFRISGWLGASMKKGRWFLAAGLSVLGLNLLSIVWPGVPLRLLLEPSYFHLTASDKTGNEAVGLIPPDASVLAGDMIASHLTHRQIIYQLDDRFNRVPIEPEYVIGSFNVLQIGFANPDGLEKALEAEKKRGYAEVFNQDGWVVLRKKKAAAKGKNPERS